MTSTSRRPRPGTRNDEDPPLLRVSGPADLLHAVPYLIGFHPADSLVVVGLVRGRLRVTARLDLVDCLPDVLEHTLGAMRKGGAEAFVAAVYRTAAVPDVGALPRQDLVDQLAELAAGAGCELREAVLVAENRWWSYLCKDEDCCPRSGRPLNLRSSEVAAAATFAGLVALPDRAALEAFLDPVGDVRPELRAALASAARELTEAVVAGQIGSYRRAAVRAIFAAARRSADGQLPEPDVMARFAVALRDHEVRDPVWLGVDDERIDGRGLWAALTRQLPPPYGATPAFLFGWASWRDGNGALGRIAAERALAHDPGYTAGDLLLAAVAQAMDPRTTPRLRAAASARRQPLRTKT